MRESARDGVILVDEASQLGTRDMAKIFQAAEDLDARVILVGDRGQHRSVTAGEPLKLLEENAGLPVMEVTEILRQSGDYKKAAKALSEGRTDEAFAELDKLGWIKEVDDDQRYRQLADAYLAAVAERKKDGKNKSALVVSSTHAEAAQVTDAIRERLQALGKLGDEQVIDCVDTGPPHRGPEDRRHGVQPRRPVDVPPERQGVHQRDASGVDRRDAASDRTGEPIRGLSARAVWRLPSATGCGSRRRERRRTASTSSPTARS